MSENVREKYLEAQLFLKNRLSIRSQDKKIVQFIIFNVFPASLGRLLFIELVLHATKDRCG
jgi:hypothetical protein